MSPPSSTNEKHSQNFGRYKVMWNNLNTFLSSIVGALSAELINMLSTINQSSGAVNMYLPVQLCVMLQNLWLIPSSFIFYATYIFVLFLVSW